MLPTENPWPAMIVLTTVAVVCLIQGSAKRKLVPVILGVAFILLAAGCYVLDLFVVTPREVITQNVYDLAAAVENQDVPKTLNYISGQAPEREIIGALLKKVKVENLHITDLSVSFKAANSLGISHFRANGLISATVGGISIAKQHEPTRWELEWQQEGGAWKIVKIHRLNPVNGSEMAIPAH